MFDLSTLMTEGKNQHYCRYINHLGSLVICARMILKWILWHARFEVCRVMIKSHCSGLQCCIVMW